MSISTKEMCTQAPRPSCENKGEDEEPGKTKKTFWRTTDVGGHHVEHGEDQGEKEFQGEGREQLSQMLLLVKLK